METLENYKTYRISLISSMAFIFRHLRLLGWSTLLVTATALFTWIGYLEAIQFINWLTGHFFQTAPHHPGILGWLEGRGWVVIKYLFLIITRIVSFYLAFLLSYCLTSPGYVFLSGAVEKIFINKQEKHLYDTPVNSFIYKSCFFCGEAAGEPSDRPHGGYMDFRTLKISIFLVDLWEGIKIGLIGILVTFTALAVNFIPIAGQMLVFILYIFYSALMFIDYPASNRHWSLRQKINWVRCHYPISIRIGILPALISMIPVINILFMALLFPVFTVHTTLNFISVQNGQTGVSK